MKNSLLILWMALAVVAQAQNLQPLSPTMDEFQYPYPVKYFDLTIEEKPMKMAYMDVPPVTMANGKTIVLMHGKNFGGWYWKNTIDTLMKSGYRVVVPDQIGFGKSAKPDIHYSLHLLAYNTHALLKALKIDSAILLGHSTGGMIAMRYAIQYPDEVEKLILEDPIGLEDYRKIVPYTTTDKLYQEELTTPDSTTLKYIKAYFVKWKEEYRIYAEVLNRWKRSTEYPTLAKVAALTTQMIYEQPVCYEFGRVKARTLIIVGREDRTVVGKAKVPKDLLPTAGQFPELAGHASMQMPNGSFRVIDNTGHIPHIESERTFNKELFDFLKKD